MSAVSFGDGREPGRGLRWTALALLVAGAHVGAGWWLAGHAFLPPPPPDGVAGVTVELEPVSVPAPPTVEPKPMENSGSGPEKQIDETPDAEAPDAPTEPPSATASEPPTPVEPPRPAPEPPPVEAAVAPPPEPAPPDPRQRSEAPAPPPTPAPAPSDAVLAPPPPPRRPVPVKKVAVQKPPKPDPREVARQDARQAQAEARQQAREEARREAMSQAAAEARAQRRAARAARSAAVREGGGDDRESAAPVASGAAMASWYGEVLAHIAAYKPDVQVGSSGTARVTITVDNGGRVTSASLSGSSGDGTLDQAAVAMMRRASPVPAPPPGSRNISLKVPVHFH